MLIVYICTNKDTPLRLKKVVPHPKLSSSSAASMLYYCHLVTKPLTKKWLSSLYKVFPFYA